MTAMSNTPKGLPLTSSRIEKIFPKLTPAQIRRVAAQGRTRSVRPGQVLIEQGDRAVPFFVVITGEVNMLSGRRSLVRARATKPGKVIEPDHEQMLNLVQTDAELGDIL